MSLQGKVAIVTGSGRGLGLAYAQELARQGASVIINDVDDATAAEAVASIEQAGGTATAVVAPVGPTETAKKLVDTAYEAYGRLDIVVTNAGVLRDTVTWKMSDDDFDLVINVHLRGTFTVVREAATRMREAGTPGRIICIGSPTGQRGNFGQTNYAATKAGLIGFTKTWARELGPKGIRVAAVCPGFVATPILDTIPEAVMQKMVDKVPLGRLGRPDEIASVYAFLASDDASYINGAVIEVSGGIML